MTRDPRPAREWPIPWMDKEPGDKDSAFTWAMGRLILRRIADGDTVKQITAHPRMPAYCTVFRWMQVVPEFGDKVRKLRTIMAEDRLIARDMRAAARGPKRKSGRKSTYSEAVAQELLHRIRQGASLSQVVRDPKMPSFRAVYRWLADRPDFRDAFIDACDERAAWLWFQRWLVVESVGDIGIPAANARLRALEARIGRLTPKTYRTWTPGERE